MFKIIIAHLTRRLLWFYHKKKLKSMNSMMGFMGYVQAIKHDQFLKYQSASSQKRLEFETVMAELGLDLKGIKFLDIGPAYGDSLDICYEKGASVIDFVEYDPFFFTYNKLKGFTAGYQLDHRFGELSKLDSGKYDLIWVRGSVSVYFYMKMKSKAGLSAWLTQLDRLASPTCKIIICPYWSNLISKKVDVRSNLFTDTMLEYGYVILPEIINHNNKLGFPVTFYKNVNEIAFGNN